ncbi:helix-turn-helix domain-containing protein [Neobacillus sp. MER 74]|uniref:helix-turn-helix domain-containing protein n=1 Tax=Neobacillus sp. MER 74 TaxID=2939566 RepID=UPI00203F9488|nr:helix-turn-helix transcriptional regulator [Neobacillus sp. MER 74]MCM3115702.1 helix-turn-helix domain-containing protein [Neobacillus sp. MER 74]
MDLGGKLQFIRKQKGITIEDLAAKSGISKSSIDRIEKNGQSPTIQKLLKLTECLEIRIEDLISENELEIELMELLWQAKKLTKQEVRKVVDMLQVFDQEKQKLKNKP